MIKEAIKYITDLRAQADAIQDFTIDGKVYVDKQLTRMDNKQDYADKLSTSSLTSIIDYIKGLEHEMRTSMILHVVSPSKVRLISTLDDIRNREMILESVAITNEFEFDKYYDQERFVIEMQANFLPSDDLGVLLRVAGNVEAKTTANYGDDGTTQKTTIASGIASKEDVLVPNPVTLVPYRTFLEVEQPPSNFVFRIKDVSGAPAFKLVAADGGYWKYEAINNIKTYLKEELSKIEPMHCNITIIG